MTHKSGRSGSSTFSTLSTAMGDSRLEYCDTTLLLRDLQRSQQGLSGGKQVVTAIVSGLKHDRHVEDLQST